MGLAGDQVDKACLVRGPRRELVHVSEGTAQAVVGRRFRVPCAARLTDIAGSPPRRVLEARCGLQSRRPGGNSRRGRGET